MEFEDILAKVGDYGKYQKLLLVVFAIPVSMIVPLIFLNNLFMVSIPDHWCRVPELEPFNLTVEQEQLLVRPKTNPACSVYNVNYTNLLLSSDDWTIPENTTTQSCKNGWNYDKTDYDVTAATEWNMFCEDTHFATFVIMMANIGSIIGTPIYGCFADRFGRRATFFMVVTVTSVSAIISVLVTNFTAFVVLRLITGTLMPSLFQLPYIMILELVGPDMRTRMNGIANTSFSTGMCILPLIAWLTRDWVKLGLITSVVSLLLYLYWPLLHESPRWLLSRERYGDATKILTKIAERNGKNIEPADISSYLRKLGERLKKEKKEEKEEFTSLLKYPRLRRNFFIITYCWIADIAAYYGLQMNGYHLAGNEFLNFFLLAIAEIPGYAVAWLFMEKLGRRWCSVTGLALCGTCCLLATVHPNAGVIASFLAKFSASVAFMAVYQQSSELYPTSVRGSGMGLNATCAGAITIAIPYVIYLNKFGTWIPFACIAFVTLTAGFGACFLPETLNENLPQTISDSEKFGQSQKFFSFNRRKLAIRHVEMSPPLINGNSPE